MMNSVCHVKEGLDEEQRTRWRKSCEGRAIYEHASKQYCVLHYPSQYKWSEFSQALESKLTRKDFNFRGAYFLRSPWPFKEYEFDADVNFAGALFSGHADFRKTKFKREADFSRAIFEGEADFRRATFEGSVEFKEPTATWYPSGSERYSFNARVNFSMATFEKRARFIGRRLFDTREDLVTFRDALIEKPENFSFDRVQLRPSWFIDTNVQRFRFTDVRWSGLSGVEGSIEEEIAAIGKRREAEKEEERRGYEYHVLARTCRELSANAEENRDYRLANDFHYLSMNALRKEGWRSLGLIAILYWALSGYGVRAVRAFLVLIGLGFTFTIAYLLAPRSPFSPSEFWQAAAYSLSALVRLNPRPESNVLGWFQTLATVEGILGPLQIALFALALRRQVMR